jgi:hypothetical protein
MNLTEHLISSFGVAGKVVTDYNNGDKWHPHNDDAGNAVAVLTDGKMVVAGHSDVFDGSFGFILLQYKSNGEIDSSFGVNGMHVLFGGLGGEATS